MTDLCSIDGCGRRALARGWCGSHYWRWHKHGNPLAGRPQRAPRGEPLRFLREVVMPYEGDDCLQWPFSKSKGYGQVRGNDGRVHLVHRLVCQSEHGDPPSARHEASHTCGRGHEGCCNPQHLKWKTHAENMADTVVHGTHNRGERCGTGKLTESQVREIRAREGTAYHREIADHYGVTRQTVNKIINRKTWSWLSEEEARA